MSEKKRGRLSRNEEDIITANMDAKGDEEIAAMINRDPSVVAKFRAQLPVVKNVESFDDVIKQLEKKFFWRETYSQLIDQNEELYFKNFWASLVSQFASQGIVATDELMIRDLIMVDIMMNRSAKSRKVAQEELNDLEFQADQVFKDTVDNPLARQTQLTPIQQRLNGLRGAMKSLSEEYKILQDKKDKKYEQLKSTREMRLDKVERSGHSFFDLVKMLDAPEAREREGRVNELYKVASDVAKKVFQQYHTYEDGKLDRPFLTPESEDQANESNAV